MNCELSDTKKNSPEIEPPTETINAGSSTIILEPRTKNLPQRAIKRSYETVELKWRDSFQ